MELLILLPLLLGVFAFDSFFGAGDAAVSEQKVPASEDEDVIVGKPSADTIQAGVGDDLVLAGSSADSIDGGDNWDVLLGENGADTIVGGAGLDILAGGRGNDLLYGGDDSDLLVGGRGNDLLYGGASNDVISSTSGADTLYGDDGNDALSGFDNVAGTTRAQALGNNLISTELDAQNYLTSYNQFASATYGTAFTTEVKARVDTAVTEYDGADVQDDVLYGGAGNDILIGDFSDTLAGGAGNDRFLVTADVPSESVTLTDFDPSADTLRIFMPANSSAALTLIDGATPAVGVTVVVGGDPVAQLLGLTAAQVPTTAISVTVG